MRAYRRGVRRSSTCRRDRAAVAHIIAPSTRDTRTWDVRTDARDDHPARTPLIIYWILGGTEDH